MAAFGSVLAPGRIRQLWRLLCQLNPLAEHSRDEHCLGMSVAGFQRWDGLLDQPLDSPVVSVRHGTPAEVSAGAVGGLTYYFKHPVAPLRPVPVLEQSDVPAPVPLDVPADHDGALQGLDDEQAAGSPVAVGEGVDGLKVPVSPDCPH